MSLSTQQKADLKAAADTARRKFNKPTNKERDRRAESKSARESNDRQFRKGRKADQVANVIEQQNHGRKAREAVREQDDAVYEAAKKAKQEAKRSQLKNELVAICTAEATMVTEAGKMREPAGTFLNATDKKGALGVFQTAVKPYLDAVSHLEALVFKGIFPTKLDRLVATPRTISAAMGLAVQCILHAAIFEEGASAGVKTLYQAADGTQAAGLVALRLSIKLFSLRLAYQRALKAKDGSGLKAANARCELASAYKLLNENLSSFVNAHRVLKFTVEKAKAVLEAAEQKANQAQAQVPVAALTPAPTAAAEGAGAAVSAPGAASTANMATALNSGDRAAAARQLVQVAIDADQLDGAASTSAAGAQAAVANASDSAAAERHQPHDSALVYVAASS